MHVFEDDIFEPWERFRDFRGMQTAAAENILGINSSV